MTRRKHYRQAKRKVEKVFARYANDPNRFISEAGHIACVRSVLNVAYRCKRLGLPNRYDEMKAQIDRYEGNAWG